MSKKFDVNAIVEERKNELDSSPLFQTKKPAPSPSPENADENAPGVKGEKAEDDKDLHHDVTTSSLHDVNYRSWRDVIENTETHNSALRLTREERYEIEDVVSELERKYRIKTSMNELARLGLLSIIRDYKKKKREALIIKVKKS
jgi:hypothetical protein